MKTAGMGRGFLGAGFVVLAAIAFLGTGCDNNHLLGAVDGGPPPADDSGPPPSQDSGPPPSQDSGPTPQDSGPPPMDARPDLPPDGGTASWTGYIENYQFFSGSDAVRISFAADAAGRLTGTVILGNGTPPVAATDPNVGYPPDLVSQHGGFDLAPPSYVAEGYPYTMKNGTLSGQRLQFCVSLGELWKGWCALQTPAGSSGACVMNTGFMVDPSGTCALRNPATNQYDMPVDCGKLMLCASGVCLCNAATASCAVNDGDVQLRFDVTMTTDGRADGSTAGLTNHNVHFTKDF